MIEYFIKILEHFLYALSTAFFILVGVILATVAISMLIAI